MWQENKQPNKSKKDSQFICDRRFSLNSSMKRHAWTHTGERPFKCEVCDWQFCKSSRMKRHYRIHTGEKPYNCMVCNLKFVTKCYLRVHIPTHTGDKPYKCGICCKQFSQRGVLNIHVCVHNGETPYKCEACTREFSESGSLKKAFMGSYKREAIQAWALFQRILYEQLPHKMLPCLCWTKATWMWSLHGTVCRM
jgi:KRAB domain-containing zinc finger protein